MCRCMVPECLLDTEHSNGFHDGVLACLIYSKSQWSPHDIQYNMLAYLLDADMTACYSFASKQPLL